MADSGFDFSTPQRREAKRFEPPPWERDAFEELQRRKAEAEAEAPTEANPVALEPEQVAAVAAVSDEPAPDEGSVAASELVGEQPDEAPPLDEKVVIEMMARLAEDEPALHDKTWKPALLSAMVVAAIGVVMVIWGVAAAVKTASAGLIAMASALVLVMFGFGFVAVALWTAVRTLRQRGVL